jgi:hypothetical protein
MVVGIKVRAAKIPCFKRRFRVGLVKIAVWLLPHNSR